MKKRFLTTLFTLSLLGSSLSIPVLANDRLTSTQDINGTKFNILSSEVNTASEGNTLVGIQGEFLTPDKQDILNQINSIRKEAYDEGLVSSYVPMKWSTKLEYTAFSRAAEASITMTHNRLSNKNTWSAFPPKIRGTEMILWNYDGFSSAIKKIYSQKEDYSKHVKGQKVYGRTGYYESIINPEYQSVAIAAFANPIQKDPFGDVILAVLFSEYNSSGSEELVGGYGPAIQYTEAMTSKIQEFSTKANLFDKDYNAIGTHTYTSRNSKVYHFSIRKDGGTWKQSGNSWWYQYSDGSYATSWKKVDGYWYFFDSNGWMQTGWVATGGDWYYLDYSGAMKTGWFNVNGKWYYAYDSGALAVNTTTPDGYYVNHNGEWI